MEWFIFERAVLEFTKYFPKEYQKKPFFYHSIRVWVFLWNQGYSEEIQIAWLLHDTLEDTKISEKEIENLFWKNVAWIVKANSKNHLLPKEEILEDIVKRCSDYGIDAMIVKIADIYDNFLFYKKEKNFSEIERCKKLADLVLKYKKEHDNKIFYFLEEILSFDNKIILLWSWDTLWTPVVWCNCEICQTEKRTRFGIFITYNWKNILIDANPDLKLQFLENKLDYKNIDYIFVTHTHTDHINWLWELSFRKEIPVFYSNDEINSRNMNYFNYLEWEKVIKRISYKNFEEIILEKNIKIIPLPLNHGFPTSWFVIFLWNIKIWIFSDTNLNLDEKILENLKNCDYLFFDWFSENKEQILELYKQIWEEKTLEDLEKIWFHTTIEELKKLKNILKPKNLVVVHISHIAWKYNYLQEKYKDLIIWKDSLSFNF